MARTDNLTNFLTDVADAIREKTGSSDPIQASSFDTAIENIPSGGGDIDWSEIGYESTPQVVTNAFDYAKDIYNNWNSSVTDLSNRFSSDRKLVIMPVVDTSNANSMFFMFSNCTALTDIPQLNTSNVTNMQSMFNGCSALVNVPQLNTSNVTNMRNMFVNCIDLPIVPQLDTSKVTNMQGMFNACQKLTNIPQLDAGEVITIGSDTFMYCYQLTTFGGLKDLGKAYLTTRVENYSTYTLQLSSSELLTHDSLMNVINNLYDIKTKGCKNQKLVLGSTNLAKLTAEEIAIATNKGWNVS